MCEREERIPMPELSPETNGEKRERWKKRPPPSLVVGGGLYRVRHPLTSYVTKWGMNAIIPGHYKTVMLTIGLCISE